MQDTCLQVDMTTIGIHLHVWNMVVADTSAFLWIYKPYKDIWMNQLSPWSIHLDLHLYKALQIHVYM